MDGLPISAIWKISIHTPAWGATQPSHGWRKWYTYFNPHSRVGSDNINRLWWMHGSNFNPHSRVGSDRRHHNLCSGSYKFQSTLPRGERRGRCWKARLRLLISIHTPAWGATVKQKTWQYRHLFQSTLPRGERHLGW